MSTMVNNFVLLVFRGDTVQAGPVPVRAAVWTGRRRSAPDRTELCSGPDYRDRTGWHEARCGPAVLAVLATSSHCHVGPRHQRGGRSSSTVAGAGEEAPDARRRERKAREREGAAWREAEAWWREGTTARGRGAAARGCAGERKARKMAAQGRKRGGACEEEDAVAVR